MNRRFKPLLFVALIAAMVLGTAAVAIAAPALTLSSTRASVTYPQPTWLKLVAADNGVAVATTVTIQYRPIGTDVWKKLKTVSAKRAGEGTVTVPVSPYRLKSITGFRAIAEGLESDVTTVAVKARLSAPITRSSGKAGRAVSVRGFIWPRHAKGSHPVVVTLWKWEGHAWVEMGTVLPAVYGHSKESSKWKFTRIFAAGDKGKWRMQVSHEDEKHAASTSRYSYIRVR